MVKNIYLFSGSKNLYNTTIKDEKKLLEKQFNLKIIWEFKAQNLKKQKLLRINSINSLKCSALSYFQTKYKLLKKFQHEISSNYKKQKPDFLIIHNASCPYAFIASAEAKKRGAKVILRFASPVIYPASDNVWLKTRRSKIRQIAALFMNNIVFPLLIVGKINKMPPLQGKFYKYSKYVEKFFWRKICYSKRCQFWIKKWNIKTETIQLPNVNNKKLAPSSEKKVLIVPSEDYEFLQGTLNCTKKEAFLCYKNNLLKIIHSLNKLNLQTAIKFKSKKESKILLSDKKLNVKLEVIDPEINIYKITNNYKYIVGFSNAVLWKLFHQMKNNIIISIELLNNPFYKEFSNRYYKGIHFISFIKLQKNLYKAFQNIIKNNKQNKKFSPVVKTWTHLLKT